MLCDELYTIAWKTHGEIRDLVLAMDDIPDAATYMLFVCHQEATEAARLTCEEWGRPHDECVVLTIQDAHKLGLLRKDGE